MLCMQCILCIDKTRFVSGLFLYQEKPTCMCVFGVNKVTTIKIADQTCTGHYSPLVSKSHLLFAEFFEKRVFRSFAPHWNGALKMAAL